MQQPISALAPRFFRLSGINILSNITVPIAGLVDVAFLGHLAEVHHLGGVALATVLFNYLYWTFGFLRMGTTGMTAQAVGRGDLAEVQLVAVRNGAIALMIGLLILLLQYPIQILGFAVLQGTAAVKVVGLAYYQARIWGALPSLLNYVLIGWFLGQGQSDRVLLLTFVGNATNVVLDYVFIVRWGWGGAGAGLATALSQYIMLLIGLGIAARTLGTFRFRRQQLLDLPALKATFTLNGNLLVRTFALLSTFAWFTNLSATFGPVVLAANAVLLQVVTLASYLIDGMAFATESLTGILQGQIEEQARSLQKNGEEAPSDTLASSKELISSPASKPIEAESSEPPRNRAELLQLRSPTLKALLWLSGTVSLLTGVLFALVFNCIPQFLFGLLTNQTKVLALIPVYTPWLFPLLGFGSIAYMLDGYFLGLTAGKSLRQAAVFATVIGFMPAALLAQALQSAQVLWLALTLFMVGRVWVLGRQVLQTY